MKALDWIFRIGLLIIGITFVGVYLLSSQNGRYQYIQSEAFPNVTMFDTQTGAVHRIFFGEKEGVAHMDLINNKLIIKKIDRHMNEVPGK